MTRTVMVIGLSWAWEAIWCVRSRSGIMWPWAGNGNIKTWVAPATVAVVVPVMLANWALSLLEGEEKNPRGRVLSVT